MRNQKCKEVGPLKKVAPGFCINCEEYFIERRDNRFYAEYGSESGLYGSIDKVAVCTLCGDDCPENIKDCPKIEKSSLPEMCQECENLLSGCEPWGKDREYQKICRKELQDEISEQAEIIQEAS